MLQNLNEKVGDHIDFGVRLPFCASVPSSFYLTLNVWIPHGKIADPYFLFELSLLGKLQPIKKLGSHFVSAMSQKVFKLEA